MLRRFVSTFVLLIFFSISSIAQIPGEWNAYLSQSEVANIQKDKNGALWVATSGGLFVYDGDKIAQQVSPLDGLYQVNPVVSEYDAESHTLWFGYSDGMLQSYEIENRRFRQYSDIQRAERFASRNINAFQLSGQVLYIATDFGVVLFDVKRGITIDTYFNIGSLQQGTRIYDLFLTQDEIYLATDNGIAIGNKSEELNIPSNWINITADDGFRSAPVFRIARFNGETFTLTVDEFLSKADSESGWERPDFTDDEIRNFYLSENRQDFFLSSVNTISILAVDNDGSTQKTESISAGNREITYVFDDGGGLIIGTRYQGIGIYESGEFEFIYPDGPSLNLFSEVNFSNGVLISASSSLPERQSSDLNATGFYRFKEGQWENYNLNNRGDFMARVFRGVFTTASSGQFDFFGSWGRGIAAFNREDYSIRIYNSTNSPLRGTGNTSSYTVISGMDTDQDGNLWAISRTNNPVPLYTYNPVTEEWQSFNRLQGLPAQDFYQKLYVDSNNQKWIGLINVNSDGRGLLVLRTNEDGTQEGAVLRAEAGAGSLPDAMINTMIEDRRGEIWIGTNRGIARFSFPSRMIDGTQQERQASLIINADTEVGGFLLRDANITSIAVDGANRKWVGTAGSGVWVISEEGGRYRVDKRFSRENSPIISDEIESIAIDDQTGTVYIATALGLVSYVSITKQPRQEMQSLFIYPNPYSYQRESGNVVIDGLSDNSRIRIVSVDGRVLQTFRARGGRVEWNALDGNGNRVPTGVYLIVATEVDGTQRGVGRVVIVR